MSVMVKEETSWEANVLPTGEGGVVHCRERVTHFPVLGDLAPRRIRSSYNGNYKC